ncbi:hypothetical protein RQP46_008760 [Phenoliferia psychrophenolica]
MPLKLSKNELDLKIGELEAQLPSDTDAVRRERFRAFVMWATQQSGNASDVLSLVSEAFVYSSLTELILLVALLWHEDGRKCHKVYLDLANLLLRIFEFISRLRGAPLGSFRDEMDGMIMEIKVSTSTLSSKT